MIGVCTHYRHNEITHAALSVMRYLDERGRKASLLNYDWRLSRVNPAYDNRVTPLWRNLNNLQQMVWTYPDGLRDDCINTLFTSWENIQPHHGRLLPFYDHVVIPTAVQAVNIRDTFSLENIAILPFSCGYPICKQLDKTYDCINLFVYGNQVDAITLHMLSSIIQDLPHVNVHVGFTRKPNRNIKKLVKQFKHVNYICQWHDIVAMMSNADLTIWPARAGGMGVIGLTSLHVGTPVIAWDAAPFNEHLCGGRNAILVKCAIETNWLGMQHVVPNYIALDRTIRAIVQQPKLLVELHKHTHEKLYEWDNEFVKGLDNILVE